MADDRLQSIIQLAHSGKTMEARHEYERIIKADPCDVTAWFWYAETWPSIEQRIQILEACLRANPGEEQVQQALAALTSRGEKVVSPSTNKASKPDIIGPTLKTARPGQPSADNTSQKPQPATPAGKPFEGLPTKSISHGKPGGNRTSNWFLVGSVIVGIAFLGILGVIAYNSIPPDPAKYRHDSPIEYYLYVPKNYSPDREWPLFVGIHGTGGSGLDCWNWWQSYADNEGFILLCPSIADSNGGWYQSDGNVKVISAVNQVHAEYRVSSKEFLAGFSAGAQFVQGFAFTYPQYVSGVSILSAGNYYRPSLGAKGIPFLVVIGDEDDPIAVQGSQGLVAAFNKFGFDVQYDVLSGVGHTLTDKGRELTIDLFRKANGR